MGIGVYIAASQSVATFSEGHVPFGYLWNIQEVTGRMDLGGQMETVTFLRQSWTRTQHPSTGSMMLKVHRHAVGGTQRFCGGGKSLHVISRFLIYIVTHFSSHLYPRAAPEQCQAPRGTLPSKGVPESKALREATGTGGFCLLPP